MRKKMNFFFVNHNLWYHLTSVVFIDMQKYGIKLNKKDNTFIWNNFSI